MLKLCAVTVLIVLSYFISGCAYWYQADKSFEGCEHDLQQCYDELKMYADMRHVGYYEIDFIKDCMKQNGYKLLLENKLPRRVKRRGPEMDTFWLLAGTAGHLED
ncbi:MAG: hypothetical protein ACYTFK_09455 [Planctomycetota bacterium]|jgi:hypothetical protein